MVGCRYGVKDAGHGRFASENYVGDCYGVALLGGVDWSSVLFGNRWLVNVMT
jgi:hypothetical protein